MSECTHDCSTCGQSCGERTEGSPFQIKPLHEGCRVGKVYGVVSGKGGVGKSMVTSQLAVTMQRKGYRTAVLDADITGPSIPKAFGIHGRAVGTENAIVPVQTRTGIQLMSVNLLLDNETDPVIWRGPVIGGVVQQFWTDVLWQDVDYMFVDMPHRRRGAECVPVPAGGRADHRHQSPGAGEHGSGKGRKDGPDDEYSRGGSGGKYELSPLPRLRQEDLSLRPGQDR